MTKEGEKRVQTVEEFPARASWKEWVGLVALVLPVFMLSTDMGGLYLAIPSITVDLTPSSTQMLWMLHIGEFLTIGFLLTMGRLADRVGRRRLLVTGVVLYGIASAIAAFSTTAWMLITFRALLGVAAAMIAPSAMSLLRNMFHDPKQFSIAIAVNLSAFSAGAALGPSIGGLLVDHFWWGAVFLVNVPVALLFLLGALLLPTYRDSNAGHLDLVSVALSLIAVMSVIFGMQEIAENGFHVFYISTVVLGIIVGVIFVRRQLNVKEPLLDLRMFRVPAFSVSLLALMLVLLVNGGSYMLFTQHIQVVLGLSPTQAGLLLILPAGLSIVGTLLAPILTRWIRPAFAMAAGLIVAAGGALLIMVTFNEAGAVLLITGVSIIMFGVAPTMTLGSELIISSVSKERSGSASAMQDVGTGLGSALGIAFMGSLAMMVYRGSLMNWVPSGVTEEATSTAMESIGAAIVVAGQLPDAFGAEMLKAIQSSFSLAIQVAFTIVALIFIMVSVMVVWRLRHVRNGSPEGLDSMNQKDG
ncbi:MFS transporter [Bacillus horti]|uniref:DHA2 family multidrug resistance protein-like MFS transporter n=1 Tax=Caldalkalibacillus horti TaxID=77523 RepID=A0ABT9VYU3_9BACI|nr:MFS transporter [Bacillus horti]MDQ0166164.1 DHA2 family multidrug resistance protein-like MFS transporter [Bacillus horti]